MDMWWLKNAVPAEQALRTADFLWSWREDKNDPTTLYTAPRADMEMKRN